MKISMNNILNYSSGIKPNTKSSSTNASHIESTSRNFDAITIKSDSRQIEEKKFSEALTKTISSQVRQSTSEEKISSLRNQVQNNTYPMNYDLLASRIMLSGKGTADA